MNWKWWTLIAVVVVIAVVVYGNNKGWFSKITGSTNNMKVVNGKTAQSTSTVPPVAATGTNG